jgi:hypothetical protein
MGEAKVRWTRSLRMRQLRGNGGLFSWSVLIYPSGVERYSGGIKKPPLGGFFE